MTIRLDSGELVTLPRTYQHLDYGYATTVHKGQGMTVDQSSVLIDSPYWDKNLSFVAMTRHRDALNLYVDTAQHPDLGALKTTLSRESTKDNVIDWPLDFAIRAGFDPDRMVGRALNHIAGVAHKIRAQWNYVVNYDTYLNDKNWRSRVNERQALRATAKDIADYLDEKAALNRDIRELSKKPEEKGLNPEVEHIYARSVARDKQAHALIDKHGVQLESIKGLSSGIKQLNSDARRYERYLAIQDLVELPQQTEPSDALRTRLVSVDVSKDYIHIHRLSAKHHKTPQALCQRIEQAHASHQQTLFDQLKSKHPILNEYSTLLHARKKSVGFESDRLDKVIVQKTKDIMGNKILYETLQKTLPNWVDGLIKLVKNHGFDHDR